LIPCEKLEKITDILSEFLRTRQRIDSLREAQDDIKYTLEFLMARLRIDVVVDLEGQPSLPPRIEAEDEDGLVVLVSSSSDLEGEEGATIRGNLVNNADELVCLSEFEREDVGELQNSRD
jgi:hypothetical protein